MSKRRCFGCGVELQNENQNIPGYVQDITKQRFLLCKRCYRMKHHNEYHSHYLENTYFEKIIKKTVKKGNLVVLIVDLFDLNSTLNSEISRLIEKNPVILVGSKRDLILKSIKDKRIYMYLNREAKKLNLNVKDIIITSATKKQGIDDLLGSIYEYHQKGDVNIVGTTNAGKSSIVNALINSIEKSKFQITISSYPGTTLDSIKIDIDDENYLYDTPGLVQEKQMIHYINLNDYKYLEMKKEVKSRMYQLDEQQSLFLGGLACFSFVSGDKTGFGCFINNNIEIHRTKYETRIDLFDNHLDDDLLLPKANNVCEFNDFVIHKFDFRGIKEKKDIMIFGFGWITFVPNNQIIEVALPKNVGILVRDAFI